MPYTLAHPAAIIPLQRLMGKRASLSALVIGSLAPDFPLFIGGVPGPFAHSLAGLVAYCLPAGLLAYLLFHLILKRPTLALLPRSWSERLPHDALRRLPDVPLGTVILSIVLGALSHLAWDAFTHPDTVVVHHLPLLQAHVGTVFGQSFALYGVLQYLSSVVGLVALAWWCRPLWRDLGIAPPASIFRRLAIGAIATAAAIGAVAGVPSHIASLDSLIYHVLVSAMQWSGAVWIAYCAAWQVRFPQRALSAV